MKGTTFLLSIVFIFCSFHPSDREWEKNYEDASIYYEIGDYYSALNIFKTLYQLDSSHAELNFRMGICYFTLREPFKSYRHFEWALTKGYPQSNYYLGQVKHLRKEFEEAIKCYQQYQLQGDRNSEEYKKVGKLIDNAKYAKEQIERPVNADITNLGSGVNTKNHEYAPLVFGAQNELYFTSRREGTTGEEKDTYGDYYEDIYVSRTVNGDWQKPIQLGPNINTATNDASVSISADGQILYIFRTNEDMVSGDLYEAHAEASGWGKPIKLGPQINSNYVETSASISNDDRVLYFSSNRKGGFGGKDIYRVVKLPNGIWSLPQNLGPTINTEWDEDAPFIHADDKTLYFSSNGHRSMGGYDIYESKLGENGLWSQPYNLGYPVNTVANDLYFVMSPDKQRGYYSSAQEGGFGGQDIYVIDFKLFAQVLSVVKGGVFSEAGSSKPVDAKVTLIDGKTRNVQGIYKTNDKTGKFIMLITPELEYTMVVEAEGYHTYSKQISFTAESLFSNTISEINLIPKEVANFE